MITYAIVHAVCAVVLMVLILVKQRELSVLDVFASMLAGPFGLILFIALVGETVTLIRLKVRTK